MIEVVAIVIGLVVGPLVRLAVDRVPDRLPMFGPGGGSDAGVASRDLAPIVSWWSATTPGIVVPVGSPDDVEEGARRDTAVRRWRAPVIDLVCSATLFVLALAFDVPTAVPALFVFGVALVALSVIDIDHYRLPDRIVFPALGACIVLLAVASLVEGVPGALVGAAVGSVAYFGFLFVFFVVSPSGMGFGDVKLALLLGWVLGWTGAIDAVDGSLVETSVIDSLRLVLLGGLAGSVLGSVVGLAVIAVRGRSAHFPFGPSLCLGALVVVVLNGTALG